ncbi:MAG TPA: SCO1664 family protein [Anaerolineae bacterium]|nr:SCO1664 family protein [Anaerolineae bacterium]
MDGILNVLTHGDIEVEGLLPWGSNYTFLVQMAYEDVACAAVYKPSSGERPLWDFPRGSLYQREYAAYVVSEALGWELVPPTIMRQGPHGVGSLQYYVEHDSEQHYFTFKELYLPQTRQIALFDIVINNADRKSGHVLLAPDERLWAIDHGVCFHTDYKLRTVIWEYVGEAIEPQLLEGLSCLVADLEEPLSEVRRALKEILTIQEVAALLKRTRHLVETAIFPEPGPGRPYPWPPV